MLEVLGRHIEAGCKEVGYNWACPVGYSPAVEHLDVAEEDKHHRRHPLAGRRWPWP